MEESLFDLINIKLIEIMNIIEKQDGFPLLSKNVQKYIQDNKEHEKIFNIYLTLSNLRKF